MILTVYFPLLLSAITIIMTMMAGSKHPFTWKLGIINQALWVIWVMITENYGFLPLSIVLTIVYLRNHLLWKKTASNAVK